MATEIQKPTNQETQQELLPKITSETPSLPLDPSTPTEAALASSDSGSANDLQKRIRRAERFGTPVQLSEEEKRNSRAERFGTAPISHGSDDLKIPEEQKRKARAERFGLPVQSVSDEEAKKKARAARFAPVPKTSTVEEDKRKARAARFSQSSSVTSSQEKGNMGKASVGT